jgi:hypothetical protein
MSFQTFVESRVFEKQDSDENDPSVAVGIVHSVYGCFAKAMESIGKHSGGK